MSKLYVLYLTVFLFCISCQSDKAAENSVEQTYFTDYDSPVHKWGFINELGKVVIKPVYDDVKDVWENLVATNFEGKWGYIDAKGTKKIEFQYKQAYNFSSGRSFVQDFSNNWLLIDSQGALIDTLPYTTFDDYKGSYAVVGIDGSKGIIDLSGKLIVPLEFTSISIVNDEVFISNTGGLYGFRNYKNEELSETYDRIYPPQKGLVRVKQNKKYKYLDGKTFKVIGTKLYDKAFDFYYDKSVVVSDGVHYLVDKSMKKLKVLDVAKLDYAGESRWKYKENGKWGLMDSQGKRTTLPRYDLLNRYRNGRIAFSENKKWGYLNEEFEEHIPAKFVLVWDYSNDRARVIDNRGVGFIDKEGFMVVKDMFLEVRDFRNGIARFQTF